MFEKISPAIASVGRALASPLPYFILAAIAMGLTKAPMSEHAIQWATAIAGIFTAVGGILLNPQHLAATVSGKPEDGVRQP
jgi:hypothetical protein